MNNECERKIWKEAVEAQYETQSGSSGRVLKMPISVEIVDLKTEI